MGGEVLEEDGGESVGFEVFARRREVKAQYQAVILRRAFHRNVCQ